MSHAKLHIDKEQKELHQSKLVAALKPRDAKKQREIGRALEWKV